MESYAKDTLEGSTGHVLLQTSRSTLSLAPNETWDALDVLQHTSEVILDPDFAVVSAGKVALVAFIVGVALLLCSCYWHSAFWYNNFWSTEDSLSAPLKPQAETNAEAKHEKGLDSGTDQRTSGSSAAAGSDPTASEGIASATSRTSRISMSRTRSLRWAADLESDPENEDDWNPLRSLGLVSLARSVGTVASSTHFTSDPHEKHREDIWKYIEETNTSWRIFLRIVCALAQVWSMLGLMYWSLLTKDDELMDCYSHPHGKFVNHLCTYTHACLRGFPIVAANVTLVLMIRILVQNRIYYSMLSLGYVLDFTETKIMHTYWPYLFVFSMAQGGAHLLLKMYYDPDPIEVESYISLARKFAVPGAIFLSFFFRYADIENTLVPLNQLVERDYTKDDRKFHSLSKLEALNERVLAFDARHRDVVGETWDAIGKSPALADVFQNIITTYDEASTNFYATRKHYEWGFFRSLWPAAVLLDRRLDREDPSTRSWFEAVTIIAVGCVVVVFFSICFFVASIWRNLILGSQYKKLSIGAIDLVTETGLAILVLLCHALLVIHFLNRTIRGMFYFDMSTARSEVDVDKL